MENRVIYSVTIAHNKEHWGTLRFLTDFFRFIGFFVYNFYMESPELKEIDTLIYLYINDDESIIADSKYISIKSIDLSEEDKQTQISYLCKIIERIKNVNEDFEGFQALYYNISQHVVVAFPIRRGSCMLYLWYRHFRRQTF